MAKPVAGTCYIKIDGAQIDVSGGVECPLSDVKRETVMALAGVAGYKEVAQEPYIKVTAVLPGDFPRQAIVSGVDMTITAELKNGTTYCLSGAFLKGEPTMKAEDGTSELEFSGTKGIWL